MTSIDPQILDSLGLSRRPEPKNADSNGLNQEQFLKLMLTQLNNQDPLQPMESGEFYTQIAQFSTVAGIQDLQSSFKEVANAMYSNQALQASAMVGRSVLVASPISQLEDGGSIQGMVELSEGTNSLGVTVYDQLGQSIQRLNLGPQGPGEIPFTWDGRTAAGDVAPPGTYLIEADAQVNGQSVALDTQVAARVDSVTMGKNGQGITLNLSGLGSVALADVKRVM